MQVLPVLMALLAAWRPAEVFPWSAPILGLLAVATLAGARNRPVVTRAWMAAAGAFALVAMVSAVLGLDRGAALGWAGLLGLAFASAWAGWEWAREDAAHWIGVGLAALSVWGLVQVAWTFRWSEAAAAALPAAQREAVLYRLQTRRAVAGLAVPGHLAILLVMALALLLDRLASSRRRGPWLALVALDLVGLLATRSLVGAGLALLVVLALAPAGLRRWLAAAAGVAASAVALTRRDLLELAPLMQRLDNWRAALWVWRRSPWLGSGPGAFRQAAQAIPFPVSSVSSYAHSLPLQALAELGPAGLFAVLAVSWWVFRRIRKHWRTHRGLAAAVAVGMLHNLVDFSLLVSGVLVPWAVLAGMLAAAGEGARDVPAAGPVCRRVLVATAATATLLAGLGAASRTLAERARASGGVESARVAVMSAPWRVPPRLLLAQRALDDGAPEVLAEAARAVDDGLAIAPRSSALELAGARLAVARRDPLQALIHARRAVEDRPRWSRARDVLRRLSGALEAPP